MKSLSANDVIIAVFFIAVAFMPYFIGYMFLEGLLSYFGLSVREVGYSEYEIYVMAFKALSLVETPPLIRSLVFWALIASPFLFFLLFAIVIRKVNPKTIERLKGGFISIFRMSKNPAVLLIVLSSAYMSFIFALRTPLFTAGQSEAINVGGAAPAFYYEFREGVTSSDCAGISPCSDPTRDALLFVSSEYFFILRRDDLDRSLIRIRKSDISTNRSYLFFR